MLVKITLLDLDTRKYPIEFSIPRMIEGMDMYLILKPYWTSQFTDNISEYDVGAGGIGCYLQATADTLIFSIRMINRLVKLLMQYSITLDTSELMALYGTNEIDFSTPFINDDNFLLGELYTEQYDGVKNCCKKFGAVFEAATGFGKNTVITYLCSHYKGSGNILILGPRYSILEEIEARARQYEVKVSQNPSESNIMYLHPSGFLNSNNSKDQVWIDWLSNVAMILIDECESITDSVETLLRDYCRNYKYIYGFSATADKYQGRRLDDIMGSMNFMGVRPDTYSILYYVGQTGFYKGDNHHFDIYTNYVTGIPKEYWRWYPKYDPITKECTNEGEPFNSRYTRSENTIICSSHFIKYLHYIQMMSTGVTLAPVKTIAQCDYIWEEMMKLDPKVSILYWVGGNAYYYDGNGDPKKFEEINNSLSTIQDYVNNRKCKILICTSVGYRGVDFVPVNDVLLCIGTKNGMINQISGRLTRHETSDLRVWLLANLDDRDKDFYDEESGVTTPILDQCVASRRKYLSEHHSVKFIDMANLQVIR